MLILALLAFLTVVGYMIQRTNQNGDFGWIISATAGFLLFLGLLLLPFCRMGTLSEAKGFEAIRATVVDARTAGIPLESAAIQIKVAEMNQWLASQQYWKGTVFGDWIHPVVLTLEPIR